MKKESFLKGFRIIFGYLAEYKKDLVVLSVWGVISAITNGVVPYIVGRLFDAILKPSKIFVATQIEMPSFLFFVILWGIVQVIVSIVDWRNSVKSDRIGEKIYSFYTIKSFGHLLNLPLSFHKKNKMGQITNRIGKAGNALTDISDRVIITLAPQFLSIFVAMAIVLGINLTSATIIMTGIVIYAAILIKSAPYLARLSKKMHKAYNHAWGDSSDAIFNIQSVKQAVFEKYEQRKIFKKFWLGASNLYLTMMKGWQNLNLYQKFTIMLTQLIIFLTSIFFIQKGQMTAGQLVMLNGYAAMVFGPLTRLGNNWQIVQNGIAAIEQGEKILDEQIENYVPKNAVILDDIKGDIVFDKVSFTYQKKQNNVLDNISFKVSPGEIIALVGESGEGKSTLIDLISGYYFAQKGKVLIDGHNVKNFDLKFLRSKIAVVPQEVVLFNDTIKKNVSYGSFSASDKKIANAVRMAHADEFIESFPKKYNQIVGERGIKLSVGQKQRVAIARAILRDPRILILDEPTSALDAKSENFIQGSLEGLMRGRTTFIIAHRLSTVRKADNIIVLKDGNIAEQGKHGDLIKIPNGIYRHLYELQIGLK